MKRKEISCSDDLCEEETTTLMSSTILKKPRKNQDTNMIDKKSDKYDRQIRLWGENGQQCLENAHAVLLNATATGTEILKCLILPGIGRFSIVDGNLVSIDDVSTNFFVTSESLGQPKAKVSCQLLQELNEDSIGSYQHEKPIELLERDPAFYKSASVVIASKLNEHDLCKISSFLWAHNIPLVICDTYGYFGQLAISLKEHVIVEAHPDNALEDLRLDLPFESLKTYMDSIDLKTMSKVEHSHTPFLVILYKYLQEWREQTGNDWPKNYKEKLQIKELIRSGILKNENDVTEIEENFDEALQNVNNAFVKNSIPIDVNTILNDPMTEHPLNSEENASFWILARSLREFVKDNGTLPLRGNLPDMFSDSKRYIELQTLYKEKSDSDVESVFKYVQEALVELQLPSDFITFEQSKLFCKNAAFLKVVRGISFAEKSKEEKKLKSMLENMEENHAAVCLLFHVIRNLSTFDSHFDKLLNAINHLRRCLNFESDIVCKYASEVNRCNFKEVHSVAAIMGGTTAQEVIKILTKQFVPCDNIFVYDGTNSSTGCGKMS